MRTTRLAGLALPLVLAGCSASWRWENQDQELWWTMAEKGNSQGLARAPDPFACPANVDAYTCEMSKRSYLEEQCAKEDAEACTTAGSKLLLHGFGEVHMKDARRFLELGCRIGWQKGEAKATRACTLLGVAHVAGRPDFPREPQIGVDLLGERCMMKDDLACAYLAYARERGLGVEPDLQRAVTDYEELCSVRHDGFADAPEPPADDPPRRRWEAFACLRLANLIDNHVVDASPEFAAQLYAAVCFHASPTVSNETTFDPDPAAMGRIACPTAAARFIENGYEYRRFRGAPTSGYRSVEGDYDADTEGLMRLGCSDGSAEACTMLRRSFEEAEDRGEIFDLR